MAKSKPIKLTREQKIKWVLWNIIALIFVYVSYYFQLYSLQQTTWERIIHPLLVYLMLAVGWNAGYWYRLRGISFSDAMAGREK